MCVCSITNFEAEQTLKKLKWDMLELFVQSFRVATNVKINELDQVFSLVQIETIFLI